MFSVLRLSPDVSIFLTFRVLKTTRRVSSEGTRAAFLVQSQKKQGSEAVGNCASRWKHSAKKYLGKKGAFAVCTKHWKRRLPVRVPGAMALLLLVGCGAAWGQAPDSQKDAQTPPGDLTQVSIENLMNMEVTSVSKKEQKLSQVAAAIYVITQEDIRHSGATNIPDLLRMVPGMNVAQINSSTWEP